MQILVQIQPGDASAGAVADAWTPWINSTPQDLEQVVGLAAHRHMWERGGVSAEPYTFTVYAYPENVERWPNGRPKSVRATTFQARKP
jgi:hypothetical protein